MATKKIAVDEQIATVEEIEEFVLEAGSDHIQTFGGRFEGGVHCQQVPDEIAPCINAILGAGMKVKGYLEIGVAAGGTTAIMNHFLNPVEIVLIDDGKHHKANLRPQVLAGINRLEIVGKSLDAVTLERVRSETSGQFDVIVIDGDHTYAGTRGDVDAYLPMLSAGGFLILHDSTLPEWGAKQVTAELKEDARVEFVNEFVSIKHDRALGVSLFRKAQ